MSKIISLFLERKTSKAEMFSLLQSMGGTVLTNIADQLVGGQEAKSKGIECGEMDE